MSVIANREGEFHGVFAAFCSNERITVQGRTVLGVVVDHEDWLPTFPSGYKLPDKHLHSRLPLDPNDGIYYSIHFIGTPSVLGVK